MTTDRPDPERGPRHILAGLEGGTLTEEGARVLREALGESNVPTNDSETLRIRLEMAHAARRTA